MKKNIFLKISFLQGIIISIITISFFAFRTQIENELTYFLMPFAYMLLLVIFAISFFISLSLMVKNFKNTFWNTIPFSMNVIAIFVAIIMLFNNDSIDDKFYKNFDKRNTVVDMVIQGILKPRENGQIILTDEYKDVSEGGRLFLAEYDGKMVIYFYEWEGFLESSKGYAYISEMSGANLKSVNLKIFKEYEGKWFYCSTY